MPEIMSGSDIAVTSRGRTAYELAMLGVPTIAMAQNWREERHEFVRNENGFLYIGTRPETARIEEALDVCIQMPREERQIMQNRMLAHELRGGRGRVMALINSL
jgi:spore coat polysaccharide biosynthesis predicted glycosyltransferase SpsG